MTSNSDKILPVSVREEKHCTSKQINRGFPGGAVVKNLPANAGGIRDAASVPGLGRSPEVFLPRKSHGQMSLASYGPRGHKESDMTGGQSTHACKTEK